MHEVKAAGRERIGEQILAANLHAVIGQLLKQAGVQIDRQHRAATPDALSQHPSHRPGARADVQAPPPLANPDRVQLHHGQWVVELGQEPQPRTLEAGASCWESRYSVMAPVETILGRGASTSQAMVQAGRLPWAIPRSRSSCSGGRLPLCQMSSISASK